MASNLFKTTVYTYSLNLNAGKTIYTYNETLTNSNTCFVHTYIGDDSTGDGTREKPYKSMSKAVLSNKSFYLFRGVVNEYFSKYNKHLIGDDISQVFMRQQYSPSITYVSKLTTDYGGLDPNYSTVYNNLIINGDIGYVIEYGMSCYNCVQKTTQVTKTKTVFSSNAHNTFSYLRHVSQDGDYHICDNNIIYTEYNPCYTTTSVPARRTKYCIFPSTCVFKYNNTVVTPYEDDLTTSATFGNDSVDNVRLIMNGYKKLNNSNITQAVLNNWFWVDSFGNQTCKIIKQSKDGGSHPNIFNKYDVDGITPLDFTLNSDIENEALFSSDTGSYVGGLKPTISVQSGSTNTILSPINVNNDGSDTVDAGDLLVNNNDVISFNTNSLQTWNRIKSNNVISIPDGTTFNGINSQFTDGTALGTYVGKYQNLMDNTQLTPSDILVVGQIYKVMNSDNISTNGIIYNDINYSPDTFFQCISGVTSFTLKPTDSGSYLQKLLSIPLESIEVTPYSNLTTISTTVPRFSCPLMVDVQLLTYSNTGATRYGKTAGDYVLFSHLNSGLFLTDFPNVSDKISYYDTWCVSNADQEFYTLSNSAYFNKITPIVKFLTLEINGHYNQQYS